MEGRDGGRWSVALMRTFHCLIAEMDWAVRDDELKSEQSDGTTAHVLAVMQTFTTSSNTRGRDKRERRERHVARDANVPQRMQAQSLRTSLSRLANRVADSPTRRTPMRASKAHRSASCKANVTGS